MKYPEIQVVRNETGSAFPGVTLNPVIKTSARIIGRMAQKVSTEKFPSKKENAGSSEENPAVNQGVISLNDIPAAISAESPAVLLR